MSKESDSSPKSKHKLQKIKDSLRLSPRWKKKLTPQPENNGEAPSQSDSKGKLTMPIPIPLVIQDIKAEHDDTITERNATMKKFLDSTNNFLPGPVPKHLRRESTAGYKMQQGGTRLSTMMDKRLNLRPVVLTIEQITEYEDAYSKFDINNDGTMSVDELNELLKNIGLKPTGK